MESRGPVGETPGGVALGAGSQAPQVEPSDAEGTPEEEVVTQGHRLVGPGLATNSIFFCFLFVKNH